MKICCSWTETLYVLLWFTIFFMSFANFNSEFKVSNKLDDFFMVQTYSLLWKTNSIIKINRFIRNSLFIHDFKKMDTCNSDFECMYISIFCFIIQFVQRKPECPTGIWVKFLDFFFWTFKLSRLIVWYCISSFWTD